MTRNLYPIARACLALWVVLAAVFVVEGALGAEPPARVSELFAQGNRLYRQEDYAGARQAYEGILDAGWEAADVYFNLGNAALKDDDLGRAVWAYARAHRLAPRDDDVATNLAYARALTQDAAPAAAQSRFLSSLASISDRISVDDALRVATGAYWVGAVILCIAILLPSARRPARTATWVAGIVLGVSLLYGGMRHFVTESGEVAVVLVSEVEVKSAPGDEGRGVFTLHAGTEVRIDRTLGGWIEVSLGPELKGWIPEGDVAGI